MAAADPATFLTLSLVLVAPATAFVLDYQLQYQQSLEELSAEQNAIENTPKRHKEKNHEMRSSFYEDSEEVRRRVIENVLGRREEQQPDSAEMDAIWHTHRTCRPPKRRLEFGSRNIGRSLRKSVRTIWGQLNVTTGQYIAMKYNQLYTGVSLQLLRRCPQNDPDSNQHTF